MNTVKKIIFTIITFLVILLKLHFEYYNLALPIVLIVVLLLSSLKGKIITIILISLNALCIVTPDKLVYKTLNNEKYFWSEQDLNISDFKGTPELASNISAKVFPSIVGKINKVYNYPTAIVFASNESEKSWVNTSFFDDSVQQQKVLDSLFAHEKLHLDITEIYARMTQDSLSKILLAPHLKKYHVIQYFYQKSDSLQNVFDFDTNHGLNSIKNEEWYALIHEKLKN